MRTLLLIFILSAAISSGTTKICSTRIVYSIDSAEIVHPPVRTNLATTEPYFEIRPRCPVKEAVLYVSRYPAVIDTLARLKKAPYKAGLNISAKADLDQLSLSFGYTLYHTNGDTILSTPLVNRWVIDRNRKFSKKRLLCRELAPEREIKIDGNKDDWAGIRSNAIQNRAHFYCAWTPASFFLFVNVHDASVSAWDRVEVHFDMYRTRTPFSDERHRWISFGAKSRSFSSVTALTDSGLVQVDSIIVRISEEMQWRARSSPDGYAIEARIPFCVLSDHEFPPKRFGFDIAILDRKNDARESLTAVTWSGANISNRHNPSEWATVSLRQIMLPLKITLMSLISAAIALLILFAIILINQKRKEHYFRMIDSRPYSPRIQQLLEMLARQCHDSKLSLETAARSLGSSPLHLQESLKAETGATFEMLLSHIRIKKARQLLRGEECDMAAIARRCGYEDICSFESDFKRFAGTAPRHFHQQYLDELQEQQEEEKEQE